jgi:hypothetical protein
VSHPLYSPDRAIAAELRRIDPGLTVEFVDDRWRVFHDLPHHGNAEASARALARETYYDYRRGGHEVPYWVCLRAAYHLIDQEKLVCVVEEPDGSYRPLDARVVAHLRRLDWQRRNWWALDYLRVARSQASGLAAQKRKATDAIWDDLRGDALGYVNRHNHSFSASALANIRRREAHGPALFPAA